jgi:hypothetical protein
LNLSSGTEFYQFMPVDRFFYPRLRPRGGPAIGLLRLIIEQNAPQRVPDFLGPIPWRHFPQKVQVHVFTHTNALHRAQGQAESLCAGSSGEFVTPGPVTMGRTYSGVGRKLVTTKHELQHSKETRP